MTIYIEDESQALADLEETLQEFEVVEVTEAIRRACRVDISDLLED